MSDFGKPLNLADMAWSILSRNAPMPEIPHLTTADLGITEADQPDRVVRREVVCRAIVPNPDGAEVECGWEGTVFVSEWDVPAETIWSCPECENENYA